MITKNLETTTTMASSVRNRLGQFFMLLKFRLSSLVVFSGIFGYVLGVEGTVNPLVLISLGLGSFFITGGANIINQIIERDLDKLMRRTQSRPLATGTISVNEAIVFSSLLSISGVVILAVFVNPLAAGLSLLSLILYGFIYTPMKQVSPISVAVGAIPGALPPLIGWVAATGSVNSGALILFMIQFIWQFPHFWAIAWVGDEDYTRAGFKMLPSRRGKDTITAVQIMLYTLFLIPAGILPAHYGLTGFSSAIVSVVAGVFFLISTFALLKTGNTKAAKRIMFTSFIYLPIIQITFLIDKL